MIKTIALVTLTGLLAACSSPLKEQSYEYFDGSVILGYSSIKRTRVTINLDNGLQEEFYLRRCKGRADISDGDRVKVKKITNLHEDGSVSSLYDTSYVKEQLC